MLAALAAGGTVAGQAALARLVAPWRADLRLVVTLREAPLKGDAPPAAVGVVQALPGVAALRYVSPDQALAALRRYLGGRVEGLDRLPSNPVPGRLEITPAASLDAAALQELVATIGQQGGVEGVEAALGWVSQVERIGRGLRWGGGILASTLALGALLAVTAGTVSVRRARAEETAILRLAGVSETRLWAPVLLPALLEGIVGAGLGVGLLWLASETGAPWLGGWLRVVAGAGPLPALSGPLVLALVGGGGLIGLAGGLAGGRP